jgi:hypothetical protein
VDLNNNNNNNNNNTTCEDVKWIELTEGRLK